MKRIVLCLATLFTFLFSASDECAASEPISARERVHLYIDGYGGYQIQPFFRVRGDNITSKGENIRYGCNLDAVFRISERISVKTGIRSVAMFSSYTNNDPASAVGPLRYESAFMKIRVPLDFQIRLFSFCKDRGYMSAYAGAFESWNTVSKASLSHNGSSDTISPEGMPSSDLFFEAGIEAGFSLSERIAFFASSGIERTELSFNEFKVPTFAEIGIRCRLF